MRIGHYMRQMFEPGGIASYIRRVSAAQRETGHDVFYFDRAPAVHASTEPVEFTTDDDALMRRAADLRLDVLHVHCVLETAPSTVPLIRTVHTHAPYCPSTGRFLKRPGAPCDRNYSLLGCAWGHVVNRCGSVRPAALRRNFTTIRHEMRTLPHIPTIVVSEFLKEQMVRAGYPADGIDVLYLPAPAAREHIAPPPRDARPAFAYLGRMIPHKGVDWLLRAAQRVTSDVLIELAGTGNQEQEYRDLARTLGLEQRVRFHGWVDGLTVNDLLGAARALVFPSIWHEPGGTVAFEAMASGRAVIMSRVGGMPEVVEDGVNGLLVQPGDETGLANAIDRLAGDWELARRLGESGRALVAQRYTLDRHVRDLMAIYERRLRRAVRT